MPTLIQQYASAMIAGFLRQVEALGDLEHQPTKGMLRELFLADVVGTLLTHQFGVGSGIIVNQNGTASSQTDVILYDRRLLPPFISAQNVGVFPAECVVATIEVKSRLDVAGLNQANSAAIKLKNEVYNPAESIYPVFHPWLQPLCAIFAVGGHTPAGLENQQTGAEWIAANAAGLDYLCLAGKWSWMSVQGQYACKLADDDGMYEETKRFIAILLDNVRSVAERRIRIMTRHHLDLIGVYIRDQHLFDVGEP